MFEVEVVWYRRGNLAEINIFSKIEVLRKFDVHLHIFKWNHAFSNISMIEAFSKTVSIIIDIQGHGHEKNRKLKIYRKCS